MVLSPITAIVAHNRRGGWTIVAHNSRGGGRVCREEVLQKRECFTSNRLETIVGVELLST